MKAPRAPREYLIFEDKPSYGGRPRHYVNAFSTDGDRKLALDCMPPNVLNHAFIVAANKLAAVAEARRRWMS